MEKRLFLAIGLSIMVVWLWSSSAPKPQPGLEGLGLSQTTDIKEDTSIKNLSKILTPSKVSSTAPPVESEKIDKRIEVLESDELRVEFSNIGASISKAQQLKNTTPLSQ